MPLVIAGRIAETTITTGTGAYTVGGVFNPSYKTFASRMAVSDFCYCMVEAVDGNGVPTGDWEEGLYTYSAANTLARTEIHASSNNDGPVNWQAGTKRIYMAVTAKLFRSLVPSAIGTQPSGGGGTTPAPTPSPSDPKPYGPNSALFGSLLFRDEFDGNTLDTSKWNDVIWYRPPEEVAAPKNYNVSGGSLNIWPQADAGGKFRNRTIDTDGKYYQKYGYFEARCKVCRGYGTWPAFWLFGHPGGLRPEIDIFEMYAGGPNDWGSGSPNYLPYDYGWTCYGENGESNRLADYKMRQAGIPATDLSADYHVYGLYWDSTKLQFWFDGRQIGPDVNPSTLNNHELYIMLDLWYGSESGDPNAGGPTPPQGPSNSFSIDYVRTWALSGGGGSSTPAPTPSGPVIINYYGDSTVWGYVSGAGGQVANPTPKVVQGAFPSYVIRNKGYNSVSSKEVFEDSGDMANFPGEGGWYDQMRQIDCTHVLFNFALNDMNEGRPIGDYTYYITNMVLQARQFGRKPIIVTPNPVSNGNVAPYVQAMKDVAVAQNCPIIDVYAWAQGYLASNGISMATWVPDGTHPSAQAYIDIGNYVAGQLPSKL